MNFKLSQLIKVLTWIGVGATGLAAFVLSFDILKNEAIEAGVSANLAWLFPAIVDGLAIMFTLYVVYAVSEKSTRMKYLGYGAISVVTLVSIYINYTHAKTWSDVIFYVSPPIGLAFVIHALSEMLEHDVKQEKKQEKKSTAKNKPTVTVEPVTVKCLPSGETPQITMNKTTSETVSVTGVSQITERQSEIVKLFAAGVTSQRNIAGELDVSPPTVGRDMKILCEAGIFQKDESGYYLP